MPLFEPSYEDEAAGIGSFQNDVVGTALRTALTDKWPATTVEVVRVTRDGHAMFDMMVKTDPITASEMSAFVTGFFTAYNNRHALG